MTLRGQTFAAGFLTVCLIMGLGGTRTACAGVAVSPLKQEINLRPGETGKAILALTYNNRLPTDAPEKMKLELKDVEVTEGGSLVFKDPGAMRTSASKWITLNIGDATLEPGKTQPVECQITVPESAAPGEYYAAILVTLATPGRTDKGVQLQYRIASGLFVTVLGRTFAKEARIARCELLWPSTNLAADPAAGPATQPEPDAEATIPRVQVLLENTGRARFDGSGKLTVYDEQKRIVMVSPMNSRRPCVFGGDSRLFDGEIIKALAPGKYTMRVEMDYQSTWSKARQDLRVEILPEQAALMAKVQQRPGAEKSMLEATPGSLAAVVPAGASRSLALTLKNVSDGEVACKAVVTEGGSSVTVRPEQFTIGKGAMKTLEVRVAGAATGSSSAAIHVEALQEGGGHSEFSIPVDIKR
jgi:hypothetical protein